MEPGASETTIFFRGAYGRYKYRCGFSQCPFSLLHSPPPKPGKSLGNERSLPVTVETTMRLRTHRTQGRVLAGLSNSFHFQSDVASIFEYFQEPDWCPGLFHELPWIQVPRVSTRCLSVVFLVQTKVLVSCLVVDMALLYSYQH